MTDWNNIPVASQEEAQTIEEIEEMIDYDYDGYNERDEFPFTPAEEEMLPEDKLKDKEYLPRCWECGCSYAIYDGRFCSPSCKTYAILNSMDERCD